MRTILVFSGKGGAGKTTVAREMAVAASSAGRKVAIADLDPQAGMTSWYARRAADTPVMVSLPSGHDLESVAATGIDELVIDLPPGVPAYVGRLISQANAVLVLCRPSPDDLSAAAGIVASLEQHPHWAFVLTQTLHRSRLNDGALRQLAALGRVAPVSLGADRTIPWQRSRGVQRSNSLTLKAHQKLCSYVLT